ncbi:MAG: hypothetical protein WCP17_03490 [bacterium]
MMRFITPSIIVAISIVVFIFVTNPIYNKVTLLPAQVASRDEALSNSKALETAREALTTKKKAMNSDDLAKLEKFLPSNVDNIRLILEIEKILSLYGMVLRDVKYGTVVDTKTTTSSGVETPGSIGNASSSKNYGILNLDFSTIGTYNNFLSFTKELESNLRIMDITSISFSSDTNTNSNIKTSASSEVYKYDFKIKTYWLKK